MPDDPGMTNPPATITAAGVALLGSFRFTFSNGVTFGNRPVPATVRV